VILTSATAKWPCHDNSSSKGAHLGAWPLDEHQTIRDPAAVLSMVRVS